MKYQPWKENIFPSHAVAVPQKQCQTLAGLFPLKTNGKGLSVSSFHITKVFQSVV